MAVVKEFMMVSMKREKKKTEIRIRDVATQKETNVVLSGMEISRPEDVVGVFDSPSSGNEVEAKGKDGKTYWVKLAEKQATTVSTIFRPDQEWEKRVDEFLGRPDLAPYQRVKVSNAYETVKVAERSGRFEDAATAYETLALEIGDDKLLDKARELRARTSATYKPKVKCGYCKSLYDETLDQCPNCGARRQA
jgi:hypothetical protein